MNIILEEEEEEEKQENVRRIINQEQEVRTLFKEKTEVTEEVIVQNTRLVDENQKKITNMTFTSH